MFGLQGGPGRRILMPVQPPTLGLGFILDLVMPNAQFIGSGQLRRHCRNRRAHDQFLEGRAGRVDIHNLPDRRALVAVEVTAEHGLGNVSALALIDHAQHLSAQNFHRCIIEHLTAVDETVAVVKGKLLIVKHRVLLSQTLIVVGMIGNIIAEGKRTGNTDVECQVG